MGTIIERLCKYMNHTGLNPNKITVEAGLSVGLIGKSIRANKGLNSETIEKILHAYPQLNAAWLLTGEGEMLKENTKPPEKKTIDEKDSYIIELQKEKIEHLKEKIQALIKENSRLKKVQESDPDMYKVAEPEPKLKR